MAQQKPGLTSGIRPVVSYEDDVHAWMYFDQGDGVLRYEAFVIGYDERGEPSTLEFVVEEGMFDLAAFPAIASLLTRRGGKSAAEDEAAAEGDGHPRAPAAAKGRRPAAWEWMAKHWDPTTVRSGSHTPWDLTTWQWQRLHQFCEEQEQRLKQECRRRWTRRLRALGYDVIPSL